MVCDTERERYCTDLEVYTSKQQRVPIHGKYQRNEIRSPRCFLFVYLGLHTNYVSRFTC